MSKNAEWQDCGLPLHAYKLTKLPRGTENSYEELHCTSQIHHTKRYTKSQEQLRQEAKEQLAKKEAKMMTEKIDIYPELD